MKLTHYTLRNLVVPVLLVFSAWGCLFYFMILHKVQDETDDTLENYKEIIIRSALSDNTLLTDHLDIISRYYIKEVTEKEARLDKDEFYNSTIYIETEKEYEPVRVLRTYFMTAERKYYELTIEISTLKKNDMIVTTIGGMLVLYVLLIVCVLIVIHFGFRKSFKPLYRILDWLKEFNVGKPVPFLDNPTPIDEFRILNETVQESSNRSNNLYNRQKHFVENAAHELQTPLAVCMNKLELLSENPDCTEEQLKDISGLYMTLSNIIRLNKTLLLLSRIENNQFPDTEEICIDQLVNQMADEFNGIYEEKAIQLIINKEATLRFSINRSLASTLVANFLKNAYVHNHKDGKIEITITKTSLAIANTGIDKPLDISLLFGRFASQSKSTESTGLGLAIVKSIADLYSIRIEYRYEGKMHKFIMIFPES